MSRMAKGMLEGVLVVAITAFVAVGVVEPAYAVGIVSENFDSDPGWDAVGNRTAPNDFGFSDTNFAVGDSSGELGGTLVRTELGFYADDVLALDPSVDTLTVSGVGVLQNPSSGNVLVGWFDGDSDLAWSPTHFLGFRSDEDDLYLRAGGDELLEQNLVPGEPFTFAVTYDPSAGDGNGAISGSINDGPTVTRILGGGDKDNLNNFNRFGLLTLHIPGSLNTTEVYFDDLSYTSGAAGVGLLGDFDDDNDIDTEDFDILRSNFLTTSAFGDMDFDLDVDLFDFRRFKSAFEDFNAGIAPQALKAGAPPEAVPEPGTFVLVGIGAVLLTLNGWRRSRRS